MQPNHQITFRWFRHSFLVAAVFALVANENLAIAGENDRYAAVTIGNPSSVTIHVQYRTGNSGPWKNWDIAPGQALCLYRKLINGRAVKPQIRFDYIAGDKKITHKVYSLSFYDVPYHRRRYGKPYSFEFSHGGKRLELYKDD